MIVRDAADRLPETLDSIRHIADEILVMDTGSMDTTVQLAQQGGAIVIQSDWHDDFSMARNACAEHVNGDWILWLDAGETLDEEPAQQLRNFVDQDANPDKAYMLFVQVPSINQHLSGEQIGQLRLVPRRHDLRFVGPLRETMTRSVLEAGMEIDALPCTIHRGAWHLDPKIKAAKAERNLRILEKGTDHPTDPDPGIDNDLANRILARAEAYQNLGRADEAMDSYREAIERAPRGSSVMLEAYYGLLTSYDGRPESKETQIATCLDALDIYPLDAQLLCGMGSYLLAQGRLDLAARSYEIAAIHGQIDPSTWHLADIGEVATTCLSLTYQLLNRPDNAIGVLRKALLNQPESIRLRRQLLDLLVKNARRDEAMAELDQLLKDIPNREVLRSAVRGALLAAEKEYQAAEPYLRTAFSAGCRDSICLRWLVVTYLSTGQIHAAEPILAEWRAIDPQNAEMRSYSKTISERHALDPELASPPGVPLVAGSGSMRSNTGQSARPIRVDASDRNNSDENGSPTPHSVATLVMPESSMPVQ